MDMSGDTRQVTLRLSRAGHRQLDTLLRQHRRLYNAALEERFTAWRTNRVSISYPQQSRELTLVRGDDPAWAGQDRRLAVETLKRADKAFGNWFRRIKAGQKGGRPRFRSGERFRTLEIYAGATKYLKVYGTGGAIEIKGLPALRFRMPRKPLPPGQPLVIRITRTPCRVTASLVYGMETPEPSAGQPAAPAGIDLGVANTITISTCAGGDGPRAGRTHVSGCRRSGGLPQGNNRARWGRCIQNSTRAPAGGCPRAGVEGSTITTQSGPIDATPPRSERSTQKRVRRLQRRMARQRARALQDGRAEWRPARSGKASLWWLSRSRRYEKTRAELQRLLERQRLAMRNWQHRLTSQIVKAHDFIAVEDLQVQNMTASAAGAPEDPGRNVAQKRGLNRSILEQGWGGILAQLEYKAERAGTRFVRVPPQYTSRACPECGSIEAENRPSQAVFRCVDCGHGANADVNAAVNVLRRGLAASGLAEPVPADAAGPGACSREPTEPIGAGASGIPRSQGPGP